MPLLAAVNRGPLLLVLAAVLCRRAAAQTLKVKPCAGGAPEQQWLLSPGGGSTTVASADGLLCLATVDCAPSSTGDVTVAACGAPACGAGSPNQRWQLSAAGKLAVVAAPSLCLTLASVDGPAVNLWPCAGSEHNDSTWLFAPGAGGAGTLSSADGAAGRGCLSREPGPGGVAVLNASALGRRLYGVGGLAAIGGARLIYEYAEPVRRTILDLLFNASGGTAFQVLKTEIEGDMDSSYGSGPSFQHSRGQATSFRRGLYLPWLLPEARARNPAIGTYSLAWGEPGWVGSQDAAGFLGPESLAYHMRYLEGVRAAYNLSFDVTGVHNERAWSRNFTIELRRALDAAGFASTRISVGDGSNDNCADCPASWADGSITGAAARDPAFASALGIIGLHDTPFLGTAYDWEAAGKDYINSENNDVDGPLIETASGAFPQWEGNAGSPLGPGLEWPQRFILSYLTVRATGTIICPLSHAWTWAYGRHNHGTALFIEPWSGHFVLGAAFWTQAQFTQATRPGWRFLEGSASGMWTGPPGTLENWLVYATLVSPDLDAFSYIAVNSDPNATAALRLQLVGALADAFAGGALAAWTSNGSALFAPRADVAVGADGSVAYALPPRTVLTLTTLRTLRHAEPLIAPRAPFPLPHASAFSAQRMEEPGRLMSDLFGAFYVGADPLGARGAVLRQAVPAPPNAWLRADGAPFTSLPAPGTAFANANISAAVLLTAADLPPAGAAAAVAVCGRVPIWQPANFAPQSAAPGVCLSLNSSGAWSLIDTTLAGGSRTLAEGALPGGGGAAVGAWHALSLAFADDSVVAAVDGVEVGAAQGLRASSGVAGLSTRWHTASFDDVRLDATAGHARTPGSWLYDILPGEAAVSNFSGWAGFALDLTAPGSAPLAVTALGRFRTRNNSAAHALDIFDAATGASVLPAGAASADLSPAGCPASDLLGFCYGAVPGGSPALLAPGRVYYVASREAAGGDAFLAIDDAAAATTHVHRDGTTLMSYAGPLRGAVTGRASRADGEASWTFEPLIECMFGPLNLIVQ